MAKTDREQTRTAWRTSLTHVEPNRILLRGYPLDEVMGRVSFAEAVYLLLVGELPSKAIGRLMEALLVSLIDHGTAPPSSQAARSVASSGAPLRASIAAGLLGVGAYHGGEIEQCMTMLEEGVSWVRQGMSIDAAAAQVVARHPGDPSQIPGFGHRVHTQDPRAAKLFQMALELEVDGAHLQMIRAVERALNPTQGGAPHEKIAINVDGAIAAVCADIGLSAAIGHALFLISRVPGIAAQSIEERQRERPMRQIDASASTYDGPRERRIPQGRS